MGYHDDNGIYRRLGDISGLSITQLKALVLQDSLEDGRLVHLDTGNTYKFDITSSLAADDQFVIAPANGAGRYLLAEGYPFDLALPIAFGLADAAVLVTAPTSYIGLIGRSYWEITTNWTGGSSSTIGVSADTAPDDTQGDILGGAAGDLAATLVAAGGSLLGTIGANVAGGIILKGGVAVQYDEITSAFTAGDGFAHLVGQTVSNPGA